MRLGIDLGGTSIRVGLFDADMQMIASRTWPTRVQAGPHAAVREMKEAVDAILLERGTQAKGIGIGSPGPIDLRTGTLGLLPNLPGWGNFPLRQALTEATGLHVVLESDANAAALAEWRLGAGKATQLQSLAMLTLGTGVGSGIILNGAIWNGIRGIGSEIGHIAVDPNGPACPCGSYGCLEVYGSASGLMRFSESFAAHPATPREVAELAQQGDLNARKAFEFFGHYVGLGVACVVSALDLPLVIVGGGVASAWDLFSESMFRTLRRSSLVYRLSEPTQTAELEQGRIFVTPALLGPAAGLIGAALLLDERNRFGFA